MGVRTSTGERFAPTAPMADGGARWRVRVRARSGQVRFLLAREIG
jgi:hypothetical protein